MGLFSGLLGLPLAPVKGVIWVGERIAEEADRVHNDPGRIRQELADLDEALADGEITEADHRLQEDALVRRLTEGQGGGYVG